MAKIIIWIFVLAICIASLTCTKIDQDMMLGGEEAGTLQIAPLETWQRMPHIDYNIPYYAKYLEGLKICLDPGHGGHGNLPNYKRGPTGLREAEVNLRVAKFLREFLKAAGAEVVLTREGDYDTDPNAGRALQRRAEIASETNCDFFISLHHNASGRDSANFSSVWYHDNPDYLYANMDLARYVTNSLEEFLRLPEPQHNGLYSDYLIYPDAGFGVLRHLRVPGILLESSFHSNFEEEERLRDPEYNRREAWAIFIGIARYARNGIPNTELLVPSQDLVYSPNPQIMLKLNDGIPVGWGSKGPPRIFKSSIQLLLDGTVVPHNYDSEKGIVTYTPTVPLSVGEHEILIRSENASKNHNLAKPFKFKVV